MFVQQRPKDDAHGVLQFFNSIYRPRDFDTYREQLLQTVRDKLKRFEREKKSAEGRLARATTDKAKSNAEKDVLKKINQIAEWTNKLTDNVELKKYYLKEWRTFRASDHLPLWVELQIDFSVEYLKNLSD